MYRYRILLTLLVVTLMGCATRARVQKEIDAAIPTGKCHVHHEPLNMERVITLHPFIPPDPSSENAKLPTFPFARNPVFDVHTELHRFPQWVTVFACQSCTEAKTRWAQARPKDEWAKTWLGAESIRKDLLSRPSG